MIYSMTGYAVATAEFPAGAINLELRSVNHRYLDIQFRMPDEWRTLESVIREKLGARIGRGKVEVRLGISKLATSSAPLQLDEPLLARLVELNAKVQAALPESACLSVNDVLRWPGMLAANARMRAASMPVNVATTP